MGRRIRWLGVVLLAVSAVLLLQLTNVQFLKASSLANSPQNPKVITASYDKTRGEILAANGEVLAQSVPAPASDIYRYQREYPQGSLFSQVVGFDSPIYGKYGVEATYNNYLTEHQQKPSSLEQLLAPVSGTDRVTLTLQPALQKVAQQALANRDGAVVVIKPGTGAIEALYSNPTYDPNALVAAATTTEHDAWTADNVKDAEGFAPLSNLAVSQIFPPGSSFKPITASAAYDHNPALVSKQYPSVTCIPLPESNKQLCNDGDTPCGGDLAQMLPPSCDPGYASVGMDVGATGMYQEATSFGYDSAPPVDFTTVGGVAAAQFPPIKDFASTDLGQAGLAYSSIGQQDVAASALQGALEASAIADGGSIMTPHVMGDVTNAQGDVVTTYTSHVWHQATTAATAAGVSSMMQAVVSSPDGTAYSVGFLPQDDVAAKTGTAQTGLNAAYNTDWMIAFAPASHPEVAVAVVLPQQVHSTSGAACSGPVVNDMIQAALNGNTTNLPSPTASCA